MDTATIPGSVYLVGAGPGDPDLLTVKAARLIGKAEAIVYDRLVSDEVMRLANPNSLRVSVGKSPKCHTVPQERINEILIDLALSGRVTVRLKGGDPFIFGRGSEEALALRRAGIHCEIVPGITAAQGCSASTGVPLTHRGLAAGVRLITGHCRQDQPLDLDWKGLADRNTTLVVYMGAANIAEIAARLMAEGLAGSTLVLTVNNGTTPRERRILADLHSIAGIVERAQLEGPVLFFIGNVVSLYEDAGIFPVMREAWPCLPAIAELSGYA